MSYRSNFSYNTSQNSADLDRLNVGKFTLTGRGLYLGTNLLIDSNGNLTGKVVSGFSNSLPDQLPNISQTGLFTGVRQSNPQATLDVSGTANILGSVTCASTISAVAGNFSSASISSLKAGTASALQLQAPYGSIGSLSCSTISAGTYLGFTSSFVGTGSSLLLQNSAGTHLTLINPSGGGTNSFAKIDFAGYSNQYTNGAPLSFRLMDDGNYSGNLSIRVKAQGSPSNAQNEVFVLNSQGQAMLGPSTNFTVPTLQLLPSASGRNGIGMGTTTSGTLTVPMWVLNNNTGGGNPGSSLTNFYMYNYGTGQFPLVISADCTQFNVGCATLSCNTLAASNTSIASASIAGTLSCNRAIIQNLNCNGTTTNILTRSQYYGMFGNEGVLSGFPGGAILGQLTSGQGYGCDLIGVSSNGTLRITASDSGEASLAFGGTNSSIVSPWVLGRGSWGSGNNVAFNNGLNGTIPLMTWTTGQKVGINYANPAYNLDVIGSFRCQSGGFFNWNSGGYTQFYRNDSATGDGLIDCYSDVGGTQTNVARMTCNGAWYNKTGTYNTLSDQRKKNNIRDARKYLDSLCKLRVRKYSWIDSDDGDKPTQLGFIA